MVEITTKRLKYLEMAESKLNALEAGGVNSWKWYNKSLKEYYLAKDLEEKRESLFNEIEIAFGEYTADIAFKDIVHDEILEIFNRLGVIFKD